jgi:predicted dehydrogenase
MNIALIGCGYVAESYAKTLANYPELKLTGAFDRNQSNLESFVRRWQVRRFENLSELLADREVEMVLNLTNPRSHYEVTKQCLRAGKHVYSEKPLAMKYNQAQELANLAKAGGLYLSSAPCSVLSETAQTLGRALRENVIGKVRLVYGNFDDGMIAPNLSPWNWKNESGVAWPAKDEFETGCTYEHAGYILTWLAAFFGPALRVTSFASCLISDKGISVEKMAPDFVVGCIEYSDNIVLRLTCSLVAPKDKSLTIIGDRGVLSVPDVRNDTSSIRLSRNPAPRLRAALERRVNKVGKLINPNRGQEWKSVETLRVKANPRHRFAGATKRVDFCRGVAELASAIQEKRPSRLSADLGVHVVELIEALQYPERLGGRKQLLSTLPPIEPLKM